MGDATIPALKMSAKARALCSPYGMRMISRRRRLLIRGRRQRSECRHLSSSSGRRFISGPPRCARIAGDAPRLLLEITPKRRYKMQERRARKFCMTSRDALIGFRSRVCHMNGAAGDFAISLFSRASPRRQQRARADVDSSILHQRGRFLPFIASSARVPPPTLSIYESHGTAPIGQPRAIAILIDNDASRRRAAILPRSRKGHDAWFRAMNISVPMPAVI